MQAIHDALPRRKEQIAWSRLWWVGSLVIASSLVVNLLMSSAVLALFPTQIITADHIIMLTVLGTLAAILVFALVAWRATRPITLYRRIAIVALLLSFAPDILIFSTGYSGIVVGAYILMHIMTAAICIIGLTRLMEVK
jgi:Family of unknown function (DUF6069)